MDDIDSFNMISLRDTQSASLATHIHHIVHTYADIAALRWKRWVITTPFTNNKNASSAISSVPNQTSALAL